MLFPITVLYAALLAAVGLLLMFRVVAMRAKTRVSILHGENMELAQAMRRHGNFTESVPLVLILMGIVEANGGNGTALHAMGVVLFLARVVQPIGLQHDRLVHPLRLVGTIGTVTATVVLGASALWQAVGAL